jgi:hypothetical protein
MLRATCERSNFNFKLLLFYTSLTYICKMIFIETKIFTKQITNLISEDEYRELQNYLLITPKKGDIIKGSGGLRKLRWSMPHQGKKGGIRIIFYWYVSNEKILLLLAYPKNEKDDLTIKQKQILINIVEEELL